MMGIALPPKLAASSYYSPYLPPASLSPGQNPSFLILMPSLPDQHQRQLSHQNELHNIDTTAKDTTDHTPLQNHAPSTMASVTSLGQAGNPFHYVVQQPKEHLFYESFLDSVSNDIVQYLAMKKNDASKASSMAAPSTPPNPKRRSGARPDAMDRKRSKRNTSRP